MVIEAASLRSIQHKKGKQKPEDKLYKTNWLALNQNYENRSNYLANVLKSYLEFNYNPFI